jgi:hypothetical protein
MTENNFDVIGDIHGHAEVLRHLLHEMNYREQNGVFRHPTRRTIFVGDFIDRGPQQRDVLNIAMRMCEAGSALAVMGNHEFNALGWAEPDGNGGMLRPHSAKNEKQHKEFLDQIGDGSRAHITALEWFQTLPVWLEFPGLRIVHACWHAPAQKALVPYLDSAHRFTKPGLREACRKGTPAYDAAEILMKGPEARLPGNHTFEDKQGETRRDVRLRWWDADATTFRSAALGMNGFESRLPDLPVTTEYHYTEAIPVLFGHYWESGKPAIHKANAACLDFSVAKEGVLAAYRWSGEASLSSENLVHVSALG